LNSREARDKYNNTLLHILAHGNNVTLAKYMILHGLRKDHVNLFNEKAVDIAFKSRTIEMVRVLTDIVQDPQLVERIESLEATMDILYDAIEEATTDLGIANEEIKTLKRKRCDKSDTNERECKRLKTDNDKLTKDNVKLTKDNGDLQTTVDNLRELFKK